MDQYSLGFIHMSDENYKLYEFLSKNKKFINWQVIAIFYSALCYVKAYLYSSGNLPKNSINSHEKIKEWLTTEINAKRSNVLCYYEKLYFDSRDARYSLKKISQGRIDRALENYKKVKELLKIA